MNEQFKPPLEYVIQAEVRKLAWKIHNGLIGTFSGGNVFLSENYIAESERAVIMGAQRLGYITVSDHYDLTEVRLKLELTAKARVDFAIPARPKSGIAGRLGRFLDRFRGG